MASSSIDFQPDAASGASAPATPFDFQPDVQTVAPPPDPGLMARLRQAMPDATPTLLRSIAANPGNYAGILPAGVLYNPALQPGAYQAAPGAPIQNSASLPQGVVTRDDAARLALAQGLSGQLGYMRDLYKIELPVAASVVAPELLADVVPETLGGSALLGAAGQGAVAGASAGAAGAATAEPLNGENPFSPKGAEKIAESAGGGALLGGATGTILESLAPRTGKAMMNYFARQGVDLDATPETAQFNPALANTPREVGQQAQRLGVQLTPAQFSEHPFARIAQGLGERSMFGSRELAQAINVNAGKLLDGVQDLAERVDPYNFGSGEQSAGEAIAHDADTALSVRRENANNAYKQAESDQADLAGDLSDLKDFANEKLFVRQPHAALTRPQYQSPGVASALQDIADAPDRVGKSPSIQSMRNLRTEFMDKANDFSGNVPDAARGLYKQAAAIVDDSIMDAAKGTPFEKSFRDASSQWKNLQTLYNEPGTPLYRILQQHDPVAVTRGILNRQSPTDIATLKSEGMQSSIEALRHQVIDDVVGARFRATPGGLGGYSNEFLRSLFEPAQLKELYLDADLGRRFNFQINPSGTGSVMLGETQVLHPEPSKLGLLYGSAQASMPQPAANYLEKGFTLPRATSLRNGSLLPSSVLAGNASRELTQ